VGTHALGLTALTGALLGAAFLPVGAARRLAAAIAAGYFVFGLLFTLHIHTTTYYHLQLLPAVSLALGAGGAVLGESLTR
jgi:hypothetical protein